jgi:hypothetical protein
MLLGSIQAESGMPLGAAYRTSAPDEKHGKNNDTHRLHRQRIDPLKDNKKGTHQGGSLFCQRKL